MGFFSNLFRKKEENDAYESLLDGIDFEEHVPKKARSARQTAKDEQELVHCCERLMEQTNQLKKEKQDYDIDTAYFNDTDIIDALPPTEKAQLAETAMNIMNMSQTREMYTNWQSKNISEERMMEFDHAKNRMPEVISKLKSNESYQSVVKRDMQKLEGEKNVWNYERMDLKKRLRVMRVALMVLASLFVILAVTFGVLTLYYKIDMTLLLSVTGIITVVVGFVIYAFSGKTEKECKQAEANLNRALTLSNQMKAKYVGITNAVEYVYDRYRVHNSYELEYLYNEYLQVSHERDQFEHANAELEYLHRVLLRQMAGYGMYDTSVWIYQAAALADPKEMVEVRHRLLEHRQKIRDRMEKQIEAIRREYDRMQEIISVNPSFKKDVKDIMEMIEQILATY